MLYIDPNANLQHERPDLNPAISRADGGTWHALANFGTPLPSCGLTPHQADGMAKTIAASRKQEAEGVAKIEMGRYAGRVHLASGLEMKSDHVKATEEGRYLSSRELGAEMGEIQQRLIGAKSLVAEGVSDTKAAVAKRRFLK